MVTVKIDGIEVQVEPNSTILEAAEKAGVHIPVLCHHKVLKPFGACRICLVEVKGSPKLMTACTTPVTDKMEVITQSERLNRLRRTSIELLLINHPLECPVCDKGGECLLQDLTFEVGITNVRFDPSPNDTAVDHTNPFIERDIDRCVLCGKCVRICDEVVNIQAISFINRGTDTYIGTAFDQPWHCEFCGQCMSVCPVGSLNNRVYLFKNRPWNLEKTPSICGFCSCGCSIVIEHEDNEVFKITEDVDLGVNHGFLCAKGRFGYELINSNEREKSPKIRKTDEFEDVSLEEALTYTSSKLLEIKEKFGPEAIGIVVSPRLTNEEAFLAQKLAREVIGTPNIFSTEKVYALPQGTYEDVENSDNLVVLNIDVTESNPVLGYAIRRMGRKEETVLSVFYPKVTALKRVATNVFSGKPSAVYEKLDQFISGLNGEGELKELALSFKNANKPVVVFNPYDELDLFYVNEIKSLVKNVILVPCKIKNNSQGIIDMGCTVEFKPGYIETNSKNDLRHLFETDKLKGLIVFGENLLIHPEYSGFQGMLSKLELLVVTDPFLSDTAQLSNVYIPVSLFAEKNGTFTNFEGRVQSLQKSVDRGLPSDLDVIKLIGDKLGAKLHDCVEEVQKLIKEEVALYRDVDFNGGVVAYPYVLKGDFKHKKVTPKGKGKYKLFPGYLRLHSGSFTRWSRDLNKVYAEPSIEVSIEDAKLLNVKEGDYLTLKIENIAKKFKVIIDNGMPEGVVSLPPEFIDTADLFHKSKYLKVDLVKHID